MTTREKFSDTMYTRAHILINRLMQLDRFPVDPHEFVKGLFAPDVYEMVFNAKDSGDVYATNLSSCISQSAHFNFTVDDASLEGDDFWLDTGVKYPAPTGMGSFIVSPCMPIYGEVFKWAGDAIHTHHELAIMKDDIGRFIAQYPSEKAMKGRWPGLWGILSPLPDVCYPISAGHKTSTIHAQRKTDWEVVPMMRRRDYEEKLTMALMLPDDPPVAWVGSRSQARKQQLSF